MKNILTEAELTSSYSETVGPPGAPSKDIRRFAPLDAIDTILVEALARDGRMPNNALAALAGIAPSTCLGRVRSLVERGVIRGFHADIDPAALGRGIEAIIAVRLHSHARRDLRTIGDRLAALDEVLDVYFVAGREDYLIHLATTDPLTLRDFVLDHLSANPSVASTETTLIFEHIHPRRVRRD